jgi:hypothetical protein
VIEDSQPGLGPSEQLLRVASACAYASGIASIFGIIFLFAFFILGAPTGRLNDIAVIVQFLLMLPLAVALYQILRHINSTLSLIALLFGLIGMVAVIFLQFLLVVGVLPFTVQIVPVIMAFLIVLVWFVINGYLARFTDTLPTSMVFHVLAWLYVGYPFWAFSVGRRLRSSRE